MNATLLRKAAHLALLIFPAAGACADADLFGQARCYQAVRAANDDALLCYIDSHEFEEAVARTINSIASAGKDSQKYSYCMDWSPKQWITKNSAQLLLTKADRGTDPKVALLAAVVTSCQKIVRSLDQAEKQRDKDMKEVMDSWVGSTLESLARGWGAPQSSSSLGDGKILTTYRTGGCTQSFFANESGRIYSWQWTGNC